MKTAGIKWLGRRHQLKDKFKWIINFNCDFNDPSIKYEAECYSLTLNR